MCVCVCVCVCTQGSRGKIAEAAAITQTSGRTDSDGDGMESCESCDALIPDVKIEIDIADETPSSWMPENICQGQSVGQGQVI